jgi:hypothetical protein
MKPDTDFILRSIAAELRSKVYPEVKTTYCKANLEQIIQLLVGLAEEFDTAASRRIEENQEIRDIFAAVTDAEVDQPLKMRLEKATKEVEVDYRISTLDRINRDLFALLGELHEHIESLEGDEACQIERSIWQTLHMKILRRVPIIMTAVGTPAPADK